MNIWFVIPTGIVLVMTFLMLQKVAARVWVSILGAVVSGAVFFVLLSVFMPTKKDYRKVEDILVIGTSADFPPFSFLENNQIVGFDIDIAHEVAKRMNKKVAWKNMPFDTLLPALQLGDVHLLAAGITATPERAQRVLFTQPYVQGIPLVVVSLAKNPPVKSLDDLKGKVVVVNAGYTADLYISKVPGPILQRLPSPAEAFLAVKTGRADAFVTAKNTIQPFLSKQHETDFSIFYIPGTEESNMLAVSKKFPELLPQVQAALDSMKQDGTIETLMKKWKLI